MLSEIDLQSLQDLLMVMLENLADKKEDIQIIREVDQTLVRFLVKCHASDLGKIIGRSGKNANAMRTVMKAKATQLACRVLIDIQNV